LSVVQSPRQRTPLQPSGAQFSACAPEHLPLPTQTRATIALATEQVPAAHSTLESAYEQAVASVPSHDPVQVASCSPEQGGREPRGAPATRRQRPSKPSSLQASHCPAQAEPQHAPSVQMEEEHSLAAAHGSPVDRSGAQNPASQNSPKLQSASDRQSPSHRPSSHVSTPQSTSAGTTHSPVP
jgi:hypothetical protein